MFDALALVDRLDAAIAFVVCAKHATEALIGDRHDRDAISTVLDGAIEQLRSVSDDLCSRAQGAA